MSLVAIVLLVGLGLSGLQIGMNTMNNFLGLHHKIGAKGHPLARFNPVQRGTTSVVIESFERCHLETRLITVVVRELSQWQTLVPSIMVVHNTRTEHVLTHLVHTLYLIIGLWVIRQTLDQVGTQRSMQLLLQTSNKLSSTVIDDGVGCWRFLATK
jgi:hypothetical protein